MGDRSEHADIYGIFELFLELLDELLSTHGFLKSTFVKVGMHPELVGGHVSADERTQMVAVVDFPRIGEIHVAVDEGHPITSDGPVLFMRIRTGATLHFAVNKKLVSFEETEVSHRRFHILSQVVVDDDEADVCLDVDSKHNRLGRVDRSEHHRPHTRTLLEAQSKGFEVEVSADVGVAAEFVVRSFDLRVGSCGFEKATNAHCSTSLPHSGLVLLETFQQ